MIVLWLPELKGEVRLYHDGEWLGYPSFEALAEALSTLGLKKATGKTSVLAQVYVPSLQVTQIREQLARSQYQKLGSQGVAYLLENFILGSVENYSVTSTMVNDHEVMVSAMEHGAIAQIKQALALAGVEARALLPDFLLLPAPNQSVSGQGSACVYSDAVSTVLRSGEHSGVFVEDVALVLSRLAQTSGAEFAQLSVAGDMHKLQTQLVDSDIAVTSLDINNLMPVQQPERHWLNLLPRVKSSGISPYWRVVAAVFTLALLSVVVFDVMRLVRYSAMEKAYQSQVYKQYSHWFASERPPADVERAIRSKIGSSASSESDVFKLMTRVAPLLQQSGLSASKVSFFDNKLEVSMQAGSIDELDALVRRLGEQGIPAKLGTVTPVASDVSGIILIDAGV